MGLEINEMLRADYFKDFKVLAGHGGLNKQIQGIAVLDAPDGYKWTKGRELVVSSGYVFKVNPNLFEEYTNHEKFRDISGMAIKVDRYLKEIDKKILNKFDEFNIPLISVPNGPSWMEIMNYLNVLVMNKQIKQFKIESINTKTISDISYQNRKINKILYQIEKEMNFPAMLYDVQNDKPYYSSYKFKTISVELSLSDFWDPSFGYTTEVLCENLGIIRFRFIDKKYRAPFSWIKIPIIVEEKVKAYFIVLEAEGLIDYFDQFSLRIGFLIIQSLYEHIIVSANLKETGFKRFIRDISNENLVNKNDIIEKAEELDLDIKKQYLVAIAKDREGKDFTETENIENNFHNSFRKLKTRIAQVSNNNYLILIPIDDNISMEENIKQIKKALDIFNNYCKIDMADFNLNIGISDIPTYLEDLCISYKRACKALQMGAILYENLYYISYSELGPLAWMDIKFDEIDIMKKSIENLLVEDENGELLKLLSIYLESNMNYSITAKKTYLHINTVRNRIKCIENLIDLDLEDPITRLKISILLRIMDK